MENNEFTINKSVVECYKIRRSLGMYWADITIDANGHTGRIQIASDFGTYQNYWGACGCDFKKFLTGLNIEYAADKFDADRWFDLNKTLLSLSSRVEEYTSDDDVKTALYNEISSLEATSSFTEFCMEINSNCPNIWEMEDGTPDVVYGITPQFKQLWSKVWPVFIEQLKREE